MDHCGINHLAQNIHQPKSWALQSIQVQDTQPGYCPLFQNNQQFFLGWGPCNCVPLVVRWLGIDCEVPATLQPLRIEYTNLLGDWMLSGASIFERC